MLTMSYATTAIIPICIAIILVSLSIYCDKFIIRLLIYFLYCILSLVIPELMLYSPLILYIFLNTPYMYVCMHAIFLHNWL